MMKRNRHEDGELTWVRRRPRPDRTLVDVAQALPEFPRAADETRKFPGKGRSWPGARPRNAADSSTSLSHTRRKLLLSRLVFPLRVSLQLLPVKIHIPQTTRCITARLIVKVFRGRIAALSARRHRLRPHFVSELHHRDEAVPAGPIPLFGLRIRAGAKRSKRTPHGRK